jgi:hypothetical protein
MHLPGAIDKALVFPPFFKGQVDETLIGPSPDLVDIIGFTGTGRTGYNKLQKFHADGNEDTSDLLGLFNGVKKFLENITHEFKEMSDSGTYCEGLPPSCCNLFLHNNSVRQMKQLLIYRGFML